MSSDPKKGKLEVKEISNALEHKQKTCFVIMPIADHPDYPPGHFTRVYEYIIKPACIKAGFTPDRADDVQHTHFIMMNILQRILNAEVAICDLSSKNPNVMYELGLRQAFDKPVALIKDDSTDRVFDTGMLSDVVYASDLRIDNVQQAVDKIAFNLLNTYEKKDEQVNSLIQLMQIQPAVTPQPTVVSPDTNVLLDAIANLGRRICAFESQRGGTKIRSSVKFVNQAGFNFDCYNDKVEAFTSLITKTYPSKCNLTSNPNGSVKVNFDFEPPIAISHTDLYEIADAAGIRPSGLSTSGFNVAQD